MEIRSYEELKSLIGEFYKTYSDQQLKYFSSNPNILRPQLIIPYCSENSSFFHILEITIPGKKAFQISKDKYSNIKQKNDIKITLIRNDTRRLITHEEIIRDLYKKVRVYDDLSFRCLWYRFYRDLLTYLYSPNRLDNEEWNSCIFSNTPSDDGVEIPVLVSFIRWCAAQEMINYPFGWGRDLCFARYFEAIYAGLLRDEEMLEKVIERANSNNSPQRLDSITELQGSITVLRNYGIAKDIYNDIEEFEARR